MERSLTVDYRIDADDKIVFVNEAWTRFAIENDAARLSDSVIGTSLWEYVTGLEVAHIYRDLLVRVRAKSASATFPFRCDSPERFRRMRLLVVPLENAFVEFSAIVEAEGQHPPTIELLRSSSSQGESFLRMCAWCKAIFVDGGWKPIEQAIELTASLHKEPFPQVTHGICDSCEVEYVKLAP